MTFEIQETGLTCSMCKKPFQWDGKPLVWVIETSVRWLSNAEIRLLNAKGTSLKKTFDSFGKKSIPMHSVFEQTPLLGKPITGCQTLTVCEECGLKISPLDKG